MLFAMLARVLDWLADARPQTFWQKHGGTLALPALVLVLVGSIALAMVQSLFKQQTLAGNLPMRLRWNFHRLMLAQSMTPLKNARQWRAPFTSAETDARSSG